MKNQKIKSYKFGIYAEILVAIFLTLKGYKILERRHKTKFGEIDLIAKKSDVIIAVEVKARRKIEVIEEVLSDYQKRRIQNAIEFYAATKKLRNYGIRCDLVVVLPWKIPQHFIGAF